MSSHRARAIWFCLLYGIRPWWMYEREKHHRGGYLDHLTANLSYALRLARGRDDSSDYVFESEVNGMVVAPGGPE